MDYARIQVAFSRFGWEHIGGWCWRYPALSAQAAPEDWFNQVVPALMYFRSLIEHAGIKVKKFTVDAHSEAGYRAGAGNGRGIKAADKIALAPTGLKMAQDKKLSEIRLKRFVKDAADSLG
jgi:hypothetical protein